MKLLATLSASQHRTKEKMNEAVGDIETILHILLNLAQIRGGADLLVDTGIIPFLINNPAVSVSSVSVRRRYYCC